MHPARGCARARGQPAASAHAGPPEAALTASHCSRLSASLAGPRAVFECPPCPHRYPQRRRSTSPWLRRLSSSSRRRSRCVPSIPTLFSPPHAPSTLPLSTSLFTSFCMLLAARRPPRPNGRRLTRSDSLGRRCATESAAAGRAVAVGGATSTAADVDGRASEPRVAEPVCRLGGPAAGALAATWAGHVGPRVVRAAGRCRWVRAAFASVRALVAHGRREEAM